MAIWVWSAIPEARSLSFALSLWEYEGGADPSTSMERIRLPHSGAWADTTTPRVSRSTAHSSGAAATSPPGPPTWAETRSRT